MQLKSTDKDVIQLVPLDILKADQPFLDYLTKSNNALCQRQIVGLAKIAAYCKDSNMREYRKKELRQQCLEFWNVPDKPRNTQPRYVKAVISFFSN